MLESFSFKLSIDCCACRISLPLNGIVATVRCYHCGEVNHYDADFWLEALSIQMFNSSFELPAGRMGQRTSSHRGLYVEFGRALPRCHRCDRPAVELSDLASLAEGGGSTCHDCGVSIRVRRADELCFRINSGARYVVNEASPGADGQGLQARTKPIVFQCLSCGGSLEVDGTSRLVSCKFCESDNYLPDGLWQMIKPVPKPEPFFIVCEYESPEERAHRVAHEKPEELAKLALDGSVHVRAAVAANPATPPQSLEKLAFDPSREVLRALAQNPALPSQVVDEMALSEDAEFQSLAARHPLISDAKLRHLAKQGTDEARNMAAQRIATLGLPEEDDSDSVLEPAKGFFARLFGD